MTNTTKEMLSVQRELGAITESLKNSDASRVEFNHKLDDQSEKMDDLSGKLIEISSTLKSVGTIVSSMALEKCGARLDNLEAWKLEIDGVRAKAEAEKRLERIEALEARTKNVPAMESEVNFWRRILGGGFHALWKIVGLLIGAGGVGASIVKFWPH